MKTKLLLVLTRSPYPATDGTRERILNEIRDLSRDFDVELLVIGTERITNDQKEYLKHIGVIEIFYFSISKFQSYLYSAISMLTSLPLQTAYFYDIAAYLWLNKNSKKYNIIYFHTIRFGLYLSKLKKGHFCPKTVLLLSFNDAISLNYKDAISKAKGPWRLIYNIEANRVSVYETKMLETADGFSIVSERDKNYLLHNWKSRTSKPEPDITVIRHGINDDLFNYNYSQSTNNLVFIGNLLYPPNHQGLKMFITKILHLITERQPEVKLIIIGRGSEYFSIYKNCEPLGFVMDPYPLLIQQSIFISPADFGAGVPTKSLLAMALGIPVISTENNAKGIEGIVDGDNICLIDYQHPQQAANIIISLLNDRSKLKRIGASGKLLALTKYRHSQNYPLLKKFLQH